MSSAEAYLAMCDNVHTIVTTTSGRDFAVACASDIRPDVALSLDYGAEVGGGPTAGGGVRKRRATDADYDAAYRKQRQEVGWCQVSDDEVIGYLTIAERASPIRFITHPALRAHLLDGTPNPDGHFATYAWTWRGSAPGRTLGKTAFCKMIRTKSLEHIAPLSDVTFVSFKEGPAYSTSAIPRANTKGIGHLIAHVESLGGEANELDGWWTESVGGRTRYFSPKGKRFSFMKQAVRHLGYGE